MYSEIVEVYRWVGSIILHRTNAGAGYGMDRPVKLPVVWYVYEFCTSGDVHGGSSNSQSIAGSDDVPGAGAPRVVVPCVGALRGFQEASGGR